MTEEMAILDHMMTDIKTGRYKPDDKLPSENELADRFGVPRITARKALKLLQELGYIYSKQGKGSYVKQRKQEIPLLLSGDISFSEKMAESGFDYRSENIDCSPVPYHPELYRDLGLKEGEARVFRIGRLRYVDQRPIALHYSYVSEAQFPDIEEAGKGITSMFAFYRSRGFTRFLSHPSHLAVSFPAREERVHLEVPSLIPLLVLRSGCSDQESGRPLELTRILYRSDRFTYLI